MGLADAESIEVDPEKAKQEMLKDGVDFIIPDGHPEIKGTARTVIVYYVATLVFKRRTT